MNRGAAPPLCNVQLPLVPPQRPKSRVRSMTHRSPTTGGKPLALDIGWNALTFADLVLPDLGHAGGVDAPDGHRLPREAGSTEFSHSDLGSPQMPSVSL